MINKIKIKLFNSESGNVFKGMLTLVMGAGLARVLGVASIPVLTRIYSPENYGVLALYTSFVMILAPVLTLRYVQAIPLPKNDVLAFNLFSLCFKLILVGSFCLSIILVLFGDTILSWFSMQVLMSWWWLIVLGAAGSALFELFSMWAIRKKQYKILAKTNFTQSLIGNLAKIFLGLLTIKPGGLIFGQFLSQSAGITSFIKAEKSDFKVLIPKIKLKKEVFIAKYYQSFVWFRFPAHILMVLSHQAPLVMMAALYSKEVTGQLSLAIMALSLPVSLVGSAMAKAYYAEIASIGKGEIKKIRKISIDIQKKLFAIGLPATLIIFFTAEPLFKIIFGFEWELAGRYAGILAPYVLFQFTSAPLDQVLNVIGSQVYFLIVNVTRFLGLLVLFYLVSFYNVDSTMFVIMISFYLFMFYFLITMFILIKLIKYDEGKSND